MHTTRFQLAIWVVLLLATSGARADCDSEMRDWVGELSAPPVTCEGWLDKMYWNHWDDEARKEGAEYVTRLAQEIQAAQVSEYVQGIDFTARSIFIGGPYFNWDPVNARVTVGVPLHFDTNLYATGNMWVPNSISRVYASIYPKRLREIVEEIKASTRHLANVAEEEELKILRSQD